MVSGSVTERGRTVNLRTGATIRSGRRPTRPVSGRSGPPRLPLSGEDDGARALDDDAVLAVPGDRLREHLALDVAADPSHVSTVARWSTRATSCSMIGPASSSA